MESTTFKSRQQFLKEFYNKDRVDFLSSFKYLASGDFTALNRRSQSHFYIDTEILYSKPHNNRHIPFKNYHKILKPLIYFLYSFTRKEKFLNDHVLYLQSLNIDFNVSDLVSYDFSFNGKMKFSYLRGYEGSNFLSSLTIYDFTKKINDIRIKLVTYYTNITEELFTSLSVSVIQTEAEAEREAREAERVRGEIREALEEQEIRAARARQEALRELLREENIINSSQCFKSENCVICLTNPPNVLFCNCGHICFCSECEKLKNSNICPICKIDNKIIRVLN